MARPYSTDLRDRVVGSVAAGRSCRVTASLFGVSVASVVKWCQRWRATGSAAPSRMGGWRQLLLKSERDWLLARIAEKPDLTLRAVMAELAERGTPASYGAVWRFFAHEGVTFKKKPARQRARPAGRRPGRLNASRGLWLGRPNDCRGS
jgi:transposase